MGRQFNITLLRLLGRCCIVCCCLIAAALAVSFVKSSVVVAPTEQVEYRWYLVAFGAVALLLFVAYWSISISRRYDFAHPHEVVVQQSGQRDFDEVESRSRELTIDFTDEQQTALVESILASDQIVSRVTETIELQDSVVARKVTRRVTANADIRRLPAYRTPKRQVNPSFVLRVNGAEVPSLSHYENVATSGMLMQQMLLSALGREAPADVKRSFNKLLEGAMSTDTSIRRMQALRQEVKTMEILLSKDRSVVKEDVQTFLSFSRYLLSNSISYLDIEPEIATKGFDLTVEKVEARKYVIKGLSNYSRRWLGLPIYRYRIQIPESLDSFSYHVRAAAPEGTYLSTATIRYISDATSRPIQGLLASAQRNPQREKLSVVADVDATFGTTLAHAYTRNMRTVYAPHSVQEDGTVVWRRPSGLFFDLDFRPIPPGLSGPIVLLSFYLSLVVTAVSLNHDRFFASSSSSLLTVMLGVPAIVSAWTASRFDAKGLRAASPTMLVELASLIIISALAVGVTIAKLTPLPGMNDSLLANLKPETFPAPMAGLAGHPWWALVWWLALSHFGVVCTSLLNRVLRYSRALRKTEKA